MTNINNYEVYNHGMKKSIKDKLFFEGLIDESIDTFVDFGCADGQILKQVHEDFPDWNLIGIDCDEEMLEIANENCGSIALFNNDITSLVFENNSNYNNKQLKEFENRWGKIDNNKSLIHYLLKYRYNTNWNREVRENYLPITKEEFFNIIPSSYEIVYYHHYTLPFTKDKIQEDFGIELKDNTHIKILLKLKENK